MARKPKTPKPLTSTSAFRAYLREVDDLADLVDAGRISKGDALDRQGRLASVLFTQLGRLFGQRLEQAPAERADVLTIETYPVPRLLDLTSEISYVHPARLRSTEPDQLPAGPAESNEVSAERPAAAPAAAELDDAGGDE